MKKKIIPRKVKSYTKKKPFTRRILNFNKIKKDKKLKIINFILSNEDSRSNNKGFFGYLNLINIRKWESLNKKNLSDGFYFVKASSDKHRTYGPNYRKKKYNRLMLNYPNNMYSINNSFLSKVKKNIFLKKTYKNKISNHTTKFINYDLKRGKFQKVFTGFLKSIVFVRNNLPKKLGGRNIFLIAQKILKIANIEMYYSTLNKKNNKKWISLKFLNKKKSYNLGIRLFFSIALNNNQEKTYKLKIIKEFINIILGRSLVIKEKMALYRLINNNIGLWVRKSKKKKWYYSTIKKRLNSIKKNRYAY